MASELLGRHHRVLRRRSTRDLTADYGSFYDQSDRAVGKRVNGEAAVPVDGPECRSFLDLGCFDPSRRPYQFVSYRGGERSGWLPPR
jgi:hypothetical protein